MKTNIIKRLLLSTVAAVLGCSHAAAQILSPVHEFLGGGNDGGGSFAGVILSSSTLYGTTIAGGHYGWGTVFTVRP